MKYIDQAIEISLTPTEIKVLLRALDGYTGATLTERDGAEMKKRAGTIAQDIRAFWTDQS